MQEGRVANLSIDLVETRIDERLTPQVRNNAFCIGALLEQYDDLFGQSSGDAKRR